MKSKVQRRVESLIAWILAVAIIVLLVAGAYYVAMEAGLVGTVAAVPIVGGDARDLP